MTRFLDKLFGGEAAGATGGIELQFEHSWPFPPWVTLLLLIGAAVYIAVMYVRERGLTSNRWLTVTLIGIRLALVGLIITMLYGWTRQLHRTDLPDLVIVLDDSASMQLKDQYVDSQMQSLVQERLASAALDEPTRENLAKAILLGNDEKLLDSLKSKYNLRFYFLGQSARYQNPADETWNTVLAAHLPEQPGSRLGDGLRDVLTRQSGRPTAALLLLTDGITTEGKTVSDIAELARRKSVPIYAVGIGNDKPPRDLRIVDVLSEEVAFLGDLVNFEFKIAASGYAGQAVQVRLKTEAGQTLAERSVTLLEDQPTTSVRLTYRPEAEGEVTHVLEIVPLADEANVENNTVEKVVHIRDETLKVLLAQEYPSYEYQYLKELLSRGLKQSSGSEKAIELHSVLQEADLEYTKTDATARQVFPVNRDELFAYDVLIFGDVNPSFLSRTTLENISDFVTQRGGGVIFLSGPRHTPLAYRGTPLEELFPVLLGTATVPGAEALLMDSFQPQVTQMGWASPQLLLADNPAENLAAWRQLPPLFWLLEAPDLRPGARVLVEHPSRTGTLGKNVPVICIQFVGAGQVVFHCTDETFRWARAESGGNPFARYWLQTIRYLSRSKLMGTDHTAELAADRVEYRRGDTVNLRVRFFDSRLAPEQDDGVSVMVEHAGGKRRRVTLQRETANREIFSGSITNLTEGHYRSWIVRPTLAGQPRTEQFSVTSPEGEFMRLQMDAADLRMAAKTSEGRYYSLQNVGRLEDELPPGREVRIASLPPTPIWNFWIFPTTFLVLIVTEWGLRKRVGLL